MICHTFDLIDLKTKEWVTRAMQSVAYPFAWPNLVTLTFDLENQ
jgi:hypothetical protein